MSADSGYPPSEEVRASATRAADGGSGQHRRHQQLQHQKQQQQQQQPLQQQEFELTTCAQRSSNVVARQYTARTATSTSSGCLSPDDLTESSCNYDVDMHDRHVAVRSSVPDAGKPSEEIRDWPTTHGNQQVADSRRFYPEASVAHQSSAPPRRSQASSYHNERRSLKQAETYLLDTIASRHHDVRYAVDVSSSNECHDPYLRGTASTSDVRNIRGTSCDDRYHHQSADPRFLQYVQGAICDGRYVHGKPPSRDNEYVQGTSASRDGQYFRNTPMSRGGQHVQGAPASHDGQYVQGIPTSRDSQYVQGAPASRDGQDVRAGTTPSPCDNFRLLDTSSRRDSARVSVTSSPRDISHVGTAPSPDDRRTRNAVGYISDTFPVGFGGWTPVRTPSEANSTATTSENGDGDDRQKVRNKLSKLKHYKRRSCVRVCARSYCIAK